MPGLSLDLKLTNLQKNNFNSIALELWDFNRGVGTVTLSSFALQLKNDKATIQWGDNTQVTSTSNSVTANKTYN